jgi:hypothetical protein
MRHIPADELVMLQIERTKQQAFFWGYVLGGASAALLWLI